MTNQHPITPPPELVNQWASEFYGTTIAPGEASIAIATQAARWGADTELEACCEWLDEGFGDVGNLPATLRNARRPKPPTLVHHPAICGEDGRSNGAVMITTFIHCTPNAEQLIVDMARVSNPANQGNHETAPRLLRYLINHKHWSPFEMASLCIKIETERDIAAQILRHRSFSFQEFSTRYATTSPAEIPALRRQDTTNRQNSTDDLDPEIRETLQMDAGGVIVAAFLTYQTMLLQGVAKETARRILPLCTPTTLYMHGTLRSWLHYIEIRTGPETQLEHRLIAEGCRAIFAKQFPTIAEAAFNV